MTGPGLQAVCSDTIPKRVRVVRGYLVETCLASPVYVCLFIVHMHSIVNPFYSNLVLMVPRSMP